MYRSSDANWKSIYIDGNLTSYQISDTGMVYNTATGRYLSGSHDKRGYQVVSIYCNHKLYSVKVHRLVAIAFIPNPENKPTVNHLDGNKDNNCVDNLEWATHKENITHAIDTGLRNTSGINSGSNKYDEATVHKVCKLLSEGSGIKEIAEKLKVSPNLPRRIKYADKWKSISSQYNIPGISRISNDTKDKVYDLFKSGLRDYSKITNILKLPDTDKTRNYLYSLHWKYKKAQGSSTIETHSDEK